jgi:hypothetical protein
MNINLNVSTILHFYILFLLLLKSIKDQYYPCSPHSIHNSAAIDGLCTHNVCVILSYHIFIVIIIVISIQFVMNECRALRCAWMSKWARGNRRRRSGKAFLPFLQLVHAFLCSNDDNSVEFLSFLYSFESLKWIYFN